MIAASNAVTFYNVCLVVAVVFCAIEAVLIIAKSGGNHSWLFPAGVAFFALAFLLLSALK